MDTDLSNDILIMPNRRISLRPRRPHGQHEHDDLANPHKGNLPSHFTLQPASNTTPKILMASNTFYFLCNWAIKHALLLFYADLTTSRSHLRLICLMHFVAFGFGLSSILVDLFQCRPMRKNWDRGVEGWCADKNAFYYANAAIMLVTDCVLYGMPLVFTRGLRLRRKQRWGLRCLFGLGGL